MSNPFFDHPILNSPYEYPRRHWELDEAGQPTQKIIESRRGAKFITPIRSACDAPARADLPCQNRSARCGCRADTSRCPGADRRGLHRPIVWSVQLQRQQLGINARPKCAFVYWVFLGPFCQSIGATKHLGGCLDRISHGGPNPADPSFAGTRSYSSSQSAGSIGAGPFNKVARAVKPGFRRC
jgi:hypothetical protein